MNLQTLIGVALDTRTWLWLRRKHPGYIARRLEQGYQIIGFYKQSQFLTGAIDKMANEQELQAELNNSETLLATLTKEADALDAAQLTIGADVQRIKEVDRLIFETHRQIMELKIAKLDLEKAPLLERLRAAQAATQVAQVAHDEALRTLQAAQEAERQAGVPLSNNSFARMALTDEIEQQHLERTLELRAQASNKPVLAVMGSNGRPGRNQPAFEVRR